MICLNLTKGIVLQLIYVVLLLHTISTPIHTFKMKVYEWPTPIELHVYYHNYIEQRNTYSYKFTQFLICM